MKNIIKKKKFFIFALIIENFFSINSSLAANIGKYYQDKTISMSSDKDNSPESSDINGKTGQNGMTQGIAVGPTSKAFYGSTALGDSAQSNGKLGTVLGANSRVDSNKQNAVALGANAKASASYSVALGSDSIAEEKNTISVGNDNKKRKIVYVDKGLISKKSNDAINGGQLYETNKKIIDSLGGVASLNGDGTISGPKYNIHGNTVNNVGDALTALDGATNQNKQNITDTYRRLDKRINHLDNKLTAGVASAIAISAVPQSYQPNSNLAGVALGGYGNQFAIAVGVSHISENGHWVTKLQGSANTGSHFGASVGVGYQW